MPRRRAARRDRHRPPGSPCPAPRRPDRRRRRHPQRHTEPPGDLRRPAPASDRPRDWSSLSQHAEAETAPVEPSHRWQSHGGTSRSAVPEAELAAREPPQADLRVRRSRTGSRRPCDADGTLTDPARESALHDQTSTIDRVRDRLDRSVGVQRLTALLVVLVLGGAVAAGTQIAAAQDWISSAGRDLPVRRPGRDLGCHRAADAAMWRPRRGDRRLHCCAGRRGRRRSPSSGHSRAQRPQRRSAFGLLGMVLTRPQRGVRYAWRARAVGLHRAGRGGRRVRVRRDASALPLPHPGAQSRTGRSVVLGLAAGARAAKHRATRCDRDRVRRRGTGRRRSPTLRRSGPGARPGVLEGIRDFDRWISDIFGASPRPVEALVGFPLLVWGVAFRRRNRQGWWMCAFGALGAAGTDVIADPDDDARREPGLDRVLGADRSGASVWWPIGLDRVLTGGGGRKADASAAAQADRQEPARFAAAALSTVAGPGRTLVWPRDARSETIGTGAGSTATRRGAGAAYRNRLESGRWQ